MDKYTNKQKIEILEKIILKLESIITTRSCKCMWSLPWRRGICDIGYFEIMYPRKKTAFKHPQYKCLTDFFRNEFKVPMPRNEMDYKWDFTEDGYKSRIKACRTAIRRLSK